MLKSLHARLPGPLRERIPLGLESWLRTRALPWLAGTDPVGRLEAKLWGGFSRTASVDLAALLQAPETRPRSAAEAALVLGRWHAVQGDLERALDLAVEVRTRVPSAARDRRQILLEALLLCRLGRGAEAEELLAARAGRTADVAFALMRANARNPACRMDGGDAASVLAEINAVFRRTGLAEIARRDPDAPLALDNLRGVGVSSLGGPRVTVIVPLHNAGDTIATALRSLAEQSHETLEVLVVDDASTDAGPDVVADFARTDPRFRLIRQAANLGSYAARNRALAEAIGAFVTVHDADDWSHPEKIARHLADLEARGVPYNFSDWTRATGALLFWGPWRPSANMVTPNFSSVFFRRELVARTGAWDTARVSADREFAARVERLHRLPPQRALLSGVPLAFGRDAEASLTRATALHAATLQHGIRREYREAAALWHESLDPDRIEAVGWTSAPPFFPAPRTIRPPATPHTHDLLFIADFNLKGGAFHSAFNMIRAGRAAGFDCAVLHYRRYDLDPTRPLDAGFRRFAAEQDVRIVAPGERLRASTVIVTYPAVFDQPMDRFPQVDHDRLAVIVNQMAERDVARTDRAYDLGRVRAHLMEVFGEEGIWIPNSGRVQTLMAEDPRYPPPHAEIWAPLRDLEVWCARTPRWRGAERPRPVLGRHGRDHPLKWPPDEGTLRAAYCAGRPCEVRFLGGARHARARLRRWPRNWSVDPFGARDVQAWLAELDVFLHFPDPNYIEEFGGAAMEAMAVGVPVILAPELALIYGDAALYAAPDAVWPLVERLWRDQTFWEDRVAAGRAFVTAHCSYELFPQRLARLAAEGTCAPAAAAGVEV